MRQLLNTLYVTTPDAWLRLEGETVVVEVNREKKLQIPLHHLGSIVTFGNTMLSPQLLSRCMEDGRSVVGLDRNGRFTYRVEGPVSGNVLLRRAQHEVHSDPRRSLELARAFIAGKLQNARKSLLRSSRDTKNDSDCAFLKATAKKLTDSIREIPKKQTQESLRGLEGDASKAYFSAFASMVSSDARKIFSFRERTRRPPRDPVNALLSFLYVLLTHDCRSALEGVGLDPQIGFFHALRSGRPSLALDTVEEFRPILADRLAITLINRGQVRSSDFEPREGGAVYLNESGRKTVIAEYQRRKQSEVKHSLLKHPVSFGLLPHLQARLLARTLRGETEGYLPFLMK
jgi:CRISPR-associated protein Cas1